MHDIFDIQYQNYYSVIPKKELEPYEVFNMEFEYVDIYESVGRISKEALIPYPPGIPLICAGEVISKDAIDIINGLILTIIYISFISYLAFWR